MTPRGVQEAFCKTQRFSRSFRCTSVTIRGGPGSQLPEKLRNHPKNLRKLWNYTLPSAANQQQRGTTEHWFGWKMIFLDAHLTMRSVVFFFRASLWNRQHIEISNLGNQSSLGLSFGCVAPLKLSWLARKSTFFNRIYIFKWLLIHCHVSFPGCKFTVHLWSESETLRVFVAWHVTPGNCWPLLAKCVELRLAGKLWESQKVLEIFQKIHSTKKPKEQLGPSAWKTKKGKLLTPLKSLFVLGVFVVVSPWNLRLNLSMASTLVNFILRGSWICFFFCDFLFCTRGFITITSTIWENMFRTFSKHQTGKSECRTTPSL